MAVTKAMHSEFLMAGIIVPATGLPLSGGYVEALVPGTSTKKTVWLDREKLTQSANPFQLDSLGRALRYFDGVYDFKFYDGDPAQGGSLVDIGISTTSLKFRIFTPRIVTKIAAYEVTPDDDYVLVDASSGAITITLQNSINFYAPIFIKKIDATANVITIVAASGETIDGQSQTSISTQGNSLHIFPDGNDWWSVILTEIPTADNADTVDNIHAAATVQANKLLALNGSGQFDDAAIHVLGSWVSRSWATVYAAATDGFLVGWGFYDSGSIKIWGSTVGSNPPTTYRVALGSSPSWNGVGFCMPVKKGDYYKAWYDNFTSGSLYWIPLA